MHAHSSAYRSAGQKKNPKYAIVKIPDSADVVGFYQHLVILF